MVMQHYLHVICHYIVFHHKKNTEAFLLHCYCSLYAVSILLSPAVGYSIIQDFCNTFHAVCAKNMSMCVTMYSMYICS